MRGFLLLIMLAGVLFLRAEDRTGQYMQSGIDPGGLNQKDWENLKSDYQYRTDMPDVKLKPRTVRTPNVPFVSLQWLQYAGYLAVILLIAGIIVWLIRIQSGFSGRSRKESAEVLEDDLDSLSLGELRDQLQKALQDENFRLAVRVRFLILLKTLDERKVIQWKREKTNRDYSLELQRPSEIAGFRRLAGYFEYVWYGPEIPGGTEFDAFRKLSDQLEKTNNT